MKPFTLSSSILLIHSVIVGANNGLGSADLFPECGEWAERGDCKPNGRPFFMQKNCAQSCHKKTHKEPDHRRLYEDKTEEFYELTARTADGRVISMENFEGYVTVLVNAARVCDSSEIFYETLEHMHSIHPYDLEIVAFPFDHPEIDYAACREAVESDEKKKGRKIHVTEAVKINGPDAHPVFRYLKLLFDVEELDANVAHYFFVSPDGNLIEHHHGASYRTLKEFVSLYSDTFLKDL